MKITKKILPFLLCLAFLATLAVPVQAKSSFDKSRAKKNVTVTYKKLPDGILAVYKNKNKTALKLTASVNFMDAAKKSLSKDKQENLCLGGKSTAAFFFPAPLDEYGSPVQYNSYKGAFSVAKSKYKSYSKKIKVSHELTPAEGQFTATNRSGKKLTNICAVIVFSDKNGTPLKCVVKYLNCFKKNASDSFSISYAGEPYRPDKAKVYISWAF